MKVPEGSMRVTTVLSVLRTGLDDFIEKGGDRARSIIHEKSHYGTQVHDAVKAYNLIFNDGPHARESFEYDFSACFPDVEGSFKKYKEWADRTVERIIMCEEVIIHDEEGYHGHLDICAVLKGDDFSTVVDIKTPEAKSKTWDMQMVAYLRAYNRMRVKARRTKKWPEARRVFALMVNPKRTKVVEPVDSHDVLFENFLKARDLKRYMSKK